MNNPKKAVHFVAKRVCTNCEENVVMDIDDGFICAACQTKFDSVKVVCED